MPRQRKAPQLPPERRIPAQAVDAPPEMQAKGLKRAREIVEGGAVVQPRTAFVWALYSRELKERFLRQPEPKGATS